MMGESGPASIAERDPGNVEAVNALPVPTPPRRLPKMPDVKGRTWPLVLLGLAIILVVSDFEYEGGEVFAFSTSQRFEPRRAGHFDPELETNGTSAGGYQVGEDGLPIEVTAGDRIFGEALTPVVLQTHRVLMYPECPRYDPSRHFTVAGDDLGFAVEQMLESPSLSKPFSRFTYFCQLLPHGLYTALLSHIPPDGLFDNYEEMQTACSPSDCRYSLSVFSILKKDPAEVTKVWPEYEMGAKLWHRLLEIVFSKEFEAALFEKLDLPPTVRIKRREMRILSDKKGYTNGRVHTDVEAGKLATMQIYLTADTVAIWDYGSCLHTLQQFQRRRPPPGAASEGQLDGEAECYFKFRYIPNSGFALKVGPQAFHSAPNSRAQHFGDRDRNTILISWY